MTAVANALEGPDDELHWLPAGEQHSAAFRIVCRREVEAVDAAR